MGFSADASDEARVLMAGHTCVVIDTNGKHNPSESTPLGSMLPLLNLTT